MGIKQQKSLMKDRIRSHQFHILFLKNWCLVFLCIAVPLAMSVHFVRYFSEKSLLTEMDTAAKRGTGNTVVTVNTLLEEVCTALEKEVLDDNVASFFKMEYTPPVKYDFYHTVRLVLERINEDNRENLYASMDVYSEIGDYVLSSPFKGQALNRFQDKSLVDTFVKLAEENPEVHFLAAPREFTAANDGIPKRVLTVYRKRVVNHDKNAFVSISVDLEKLSEYITDNLDGRNGAYLIVDDEHRVVMDTSSRFDDQVLSVLDNSADTAMEVEINGERIWLTWVPMEHFQWKFVQIIPMDEIHQTNIKLNRLTMTVVLVGLIIAALISYGTTSKLYYPIEAILRIMENPSEDGIISDEKGEVGFLLVSILDLFQRNITLEQEMLDRVITLRRARAKALQEQMTPHFLNNVLQTINWSAITETGSENSVTSRSLLLLADIIRMSKEKTTNLTTVADEIEYTKKFVEIERLRYGDNIRCTYNIDPMIENSPIPCISLQTLVENSISHGLQPKNANGNIYISIRSLPDEGLRICVEDDGIGFEEARIKQIFDIMENEFIYVGEHLGIVNLLQRFRLIYGPNCHFEIKKSEYGGACVLIDLPKLPEWWNFA